MSISVKSLTKQYGTQKALDNVSFDIAKGEIVGLLGPNGAGKTTTMKILAGFMSHFEGEASIEGVDVNDDPIGVKQKIGYLPEHNPLYLDMYVKEYLAFIGSIYKLKGVEAKVKQVIESTGLGLEQHKVIQVLSKGYRQRVGLAQALLHDPEVLILDEPTTGLDPNQLVEIRDLIRHIGREKTIIFSSHIMQEVQALCDRVIILNRGQIVADDRIDYLDQTLNNQREILLELNEHLEGKWKITDLVEVKHLGANATYRLVFKKTEKDPRADIFDFVVANQRKILSMQERKTSMEDVFQKITLN